MWGREVAPPKTLHPRTPRGKVWEQRAAVLRRCFFLSLVQYVVESPPLR